MKEKCSDMYVFDTSPLSVILKHYYQSRFPSLWISFERLINLGNVISVSEVFHELEKGPLSGNQWVNANKLYLRLPPKVKRILSEAYLLQSNLLVNGKRRILKGGGENPFADPFVVAKAAVNDGIVVTLETKKPNSASIPNICEHFGVPCINLEGFMNRVCWTF